MEYEPILAFFRGFEPPHQDEKSDPDPHQIKIRIRIRIPIRIRVRSRIRIRIRIKVMHTEKNENRYFNYFKFVLQEYSDLVKRELLSERQQVNFLTADGVKFAHPLHHLGKSKEDLPLIAVDSFRNGCVREAPSNKSFVTLCLSVADPSHFGGDSDPDPRIHVSD
jgi:hypothetical protein